MDVKHSVRNAFLKAQANATCHQKYLITLKEVYSKSPFDEFATSFMNCVKCLLFQDSQMKDNNVERSLQFAAKFATSLRPTTNEEEDICPFLKRVFNDLLPFHNYNFILARYRTCRLINLLLNALGEDGFLSNDVCDDIQATMLLRIRDVKACIRQEAVTALQRLQNPLDAECPINEAYIRCFGDFHISVRQVVVESIAINNNNLNIILKRCKDQSEQVRHAVYQKFSLFPMMGLKIEQRRYLLMCGFRDKSPLVKKCVETVLLPKWLTRVNEDYFIFLKALLLDANKDDLELTAELWTNVLHVFFKSSPIMELIGCLPLENKLIPLEKLEVEVMAFWNILFKYFHSKDTFEEYVETIVPELVHFCAYVNEVFNKYQNSTSPLQQHNLEYILHSLLEMLNMFDYADEMSRNVLVKLVTHMLTSTLLDVHSLSELAKILMQLYPNEDVCMQEICTIISDIRKPLVVRMVGKKKGKVTNEMKIAAIRLKLMELDMQLEEEVEQTNYEVAIKLKEQVNKLQVEKANLIAEDEERENEEVATERVEESRNDLKTISYCLDVLIAFWKRTRRPLSPTMQGYAEEFLNPLLLWPDPVILNKVYECLGLLAFNSQDLAMQTMDMFTKQFMRYKKDSAESVHATVTKVIIDLLRLYGTKLLGKANEIADGNIDLAINNDTFRQKGKRLLYDASSTVSDIVQEMDALPEASFLNIIKILIEMIKDSSESIRELGGKGLVILIISGLCKSCMVVSEIIIGWANPATDTKLRSIFGQCLDQMMEDSTIDLRLFETAVIPVLTAFANAPKTSPLADVDIDVIIKFLAVFATGNRVKGTVSHTNLANSLCYKICMNLTSKSNAIYVKCLLALDIPRDDQIALQDLIKQVKMIQKNLSEKNIQRSFAKYLKALESCVTKDMNLATNETVQTALAENVAPAAAGLDDVVDAVQQITLQESNSVSNLANTNSSEHSDEAEKENHHVPPSPPEKLPLGNNNNKKKIATPRVPSGPPPEKLPLNNNNKKKSAAQKDTKIESSVPVKRRRSQRSSVQKKTSFNETTLHTIVEQSSAQSILIDDDDLRIETPSPTNSSSSANSVRGTRTITETSGSDSDSNSNSRNRKKRKTRQGTSKKKPFYEF